MGEEVERIAASIVRVKLFRSVGECCCLGCSSSVCDSIGWIRPNHWPQHTMDTATVNPDAHHTMLALFELNRLLGKLFSGHSVRREPENFNDEHLIAMRRIYWFKGTWSDCLQIKFGRCWPSCGKKTDTNWVGFTNCVVRIETGVMKEGLPS